MSENNFSDSYFEARQRFTDAAATAGADVKSYPVCDSSPETLAIDVAILGAPSERTLVVSSGVHGAEGFLGSAIQLALLEKLATALGAGDAPDVGLILIHSLNPFGFARLRRVNEDNVDLNRNFLTSTDQYAGAPDAYAALDVFLNPPSPPPSYEPFRLRALWHICRYGLQPLKQAIAGGQFEYPEGLFFGGKSPSTSHQIVQANCDSWLSSAKQIVHVDLHSGLGAFGTYKLLLPETAHPATYAWYRESFGAENVEVAENKSGIAYSISGAFGSWMQQHFRDRDFRFAVAEFGTYGVIRVLRALRAENRAHHYGDHQTAAYRRAKQELLECFCPRSPLWRRKVVSSGMKIIDQAARALIRDDNETNR